MSVPPRAGARGQLLVLDGDPRPELARRGIVLRPGQGALPLPIREPGAVRRMLADVALSGADVVSAMTADLHHRALSRIGASRRIREWLEEAVDLARDAASKAEDADRAGTPAGRRVRVAGLVGPLEGRAGPGAAPDVDVAGPEHHAHASLLADAGVDLIRIEAIDTIVESEAATLAARDTGLEVWTGIALDQTGVKLPSGESLATWLAAVVPLEPAALLLSATTWAAIEAALAAAADGLRLLGLAGRIRLGAALPLDAAVRPATGPRVEAVDGGPGDDQERAGSDSGTREGGGGKRPRQDAEAGERPAHDAEAAEGAARETAPSPIAEAPLPDRSARRLAESAASLLSAGRDGSPVRVAALRAAADAEEAARGTEAGAARDRVTAWLADAADRARRGPALLMSGPLRVGRAQSDPLRGGSGPDAGAGPDWSDRSLLPAGFAWDVVDAGRLRDLPEERYRFAIVMRDAVQALDRSGVSRLVDTLEPGAWLLVEAADGTGLPAIDERLADLQPAPAVRGLGAWWIVRRRP